MIHDINGLPIFGSEEYPIDAKRTVKMNPGDKYMNNGKKGIATIESVVEAGNFVNRRSGNGMAVIFRYSGSTYPLKLGMVAFLKSHKAVV